MALRRLWSFALGAALAPVAAWTGVRLLGSERGAPSTQLIAFTPYVAAGSAVPVAAALATRRWGHAALGGALTAALAACVLPRAVRARRTDVVSGRRRLRVLTANLYLGTADARALVDAVRERGVEVLAVQELTPSVVRALDDAGLGDLLPHRVVHPIPGRGAGSGLFSAHPLTETDVRLLPSGHAQVHALLRVPHAGAVRVESAHPCAPANDVTARRWATEIALQPPATPDGEVRLLLGDFNSTLDHGGLRRLIATGYRDAAEVVGSGLAPTWPFLGRTAFGRSIPRVTIDHVLADRRIGVVSVSTVEIPGSDHRGVFAELVPPSAIAPVVEESGLIKEFVHPRSQAEARRVRRS